MDLLTLSLHRIIHGAGFSRDECLQYRPVVYSNAIQSLASILRAMPHLNIAFDSPVTDVCIN